MIELRKDGRIEPYKLKEDRHERKDLADKVPQKAAELRRKLADWRRAVNAPMPAPAPQYDPSDAPQRAPRQMS